MKCHICKEGQLRLKGCWYRKDGTLIRKRYCTHCGYKANTMEVSIKDLDRKNKLIDGLKRVVKEYLDTRG